MPIDVVKISPEEAIALCYVFSGAADENGKPIPSALACMDERGIEQSLTVDDLLNRYPSFDESMIDRAFECLKMEAHVVMEPSNENALKHGFNASQLVRSARGEHVKDYEYHILQIIPQPRS